MSEDNSDQSSCRVPKSPPDFYREFCRADGTFNFGAYIRSDAFVQTRKYARQKISNMMVASMNRGIEAVVQGFDKVKITAEAYDKAHAISRIFTDLTEEVGLRTPYELGFLLLSPIGSDVITDIYLPNEQIVRPSHCDISGLAMISATRYAKRNGMKVNSWAHSHGALNTFLSGEDKHTLETNVAETFEGIMRRASYPWGEELPYYVQAFPTLVINAKGDVLAAIAIKYPQIVSSPIDELLRVKTKYKLLQGLPITKIDKSHNIDLCERNIISRLCYGNGDGGIVLQTSDGNKKLSDLYKIPESVEPIELSKETEPSDDLSKRIAELELKYNNMYQAFEKVRREYDTLEKNYLGLQERIMRVEERAGSYTNSGQAGGLISGILSKTYTNSIQFFKKRNEQIKAKIVSLLKGTAPLI